MGFIVGPLTTPTTARRSKIQWIILWFMEILLTSEYMNFFRFSLSFHSKRPPKYVRMLKHTANFRCYCYRTFQLIEFRFRLLVSPKKSFEKGYRDDYSFGCCVLFEQVLRKIISWKFAELFLPGNRIESYELEALFADKLNWKYFS